jgi:alpha-galactosidase
LELVARYRQLGPLFNGDWYPLTSFSIAETDWQVSQYHRPDLGQGLILAFRRGDSPYHSIDVSLRGLDPAADYELTFGGGKKRIVNGKELMGQFVLEIPEKRKSELITYKKTR